jgi:hypothetical protein
MKKKHALKRKRSTQTPIVQSPPSSNLSDTVANSQETNRPKTIARDNIFRFKGPPEWFDMWIRPIYDRWYDEISYPIKIHCVEEDEYYVGYRYYSIDEPNSVSREQMAARDMMTHYPKAAWKPILGPRSDIPSPTIWDVVEIPESKPFPPEAAPGSVADQKIQALRPESSAAERIEEKKRRMLERAERKKRMFDRF